MKKHGKVFVVSILLLAAIAGGVWIARAAGDDSSTTAAVDGQILAEIREHSELMNNLEYLTDRIGPRLTGSPLLRQATTGRRRCSGNMG